MKVRVRDVMIGNAISKRASPDVGRKAQTSFQMGRIRIDVTVCGRCGGAVKIIACIEDPSVNNKILAHLDTKSGTPATVNQIPEPRAGPLERLYD